MVHDIDKIKLFILDMDGTIYLGNSLFEYTKPFLSAVKNTGRDFCFFTNNSSCNRQAYIDKLSKMGISISPDKMLLSNDVIIQWLCENRKGQSAYVVGTPYLIEDFNRAGIFIDAQNPDYVVLGFDTTLTYEKLSKACAFVREGRPIFGVNPDLNCPTETGFIPDCGSMAALINASTGVSCEFFGKPSRHTLNFLLHKFSTSANGYAPEEIAIIGDRLYTDIALANNSPVTSILVLSGETSREDADKSDIRPDIIVENLKELMKYL